MMLWSSASWVYTLPEFRTVHGPTRRFSYETIYLYVWRDKGAGGELWRHRRQAGDCRFPASQRFAPSGCQSPVPVPVTRSRGSEPSALMLQREDTLLVFVLEKRIRLPSGENLMTFW